MSQIAALQALDAEIIGAFVDAGLADAAVYTPPGGGAGIACEVMVDRGQVVYGADGDEVAGLRTLVTFQLAQLTPERGGVVVVDGSTLTLDSEDDNDKAMARWVAV